MSRTTPRARGWRPATARSKVVLPAPLGPMRPRRSPPLRDIETSLTARKLSNWTRRESMESSAGWAVGGVDGVAVEGEGAARKAVKPGVVMGAIRVRVEEWGGKEETGWGEGGGQGDEGTRKSGGAGGFLRRGGSGLLRA